MAAAVGLLVAAVDAVAPSAALPSYRHTTEVLRNSAVPPLVGSSAAATGNPAVAKSLLITRFSVGFASRLTAAIGMRPTGGPRAGPGPSVGHDSKRAAVLKNWLVCVPFPLAKLP